LCPSDTGDSLKIHRIIIELGQRDKYVILAVSTDGSVYFANPQGIFAAKRSDLPDLIAAASLQVLASAQTLLGVLPECMESEFPAAGHVRFALITGSGVRSIVESATKLEKGGHARLGAVWIAVKELLAYLMQFIEGTHLVRPDQDASAVVGDAVDD
jgi:hypothetical protein